MRQPPESDPVPPSKSDQSAVAVLLRDMADTTWRMFVPIVGLLLVGRYLDVKWHTKPFLMLAGAAVGAVIAAVLIKAQLKQSSNKDEGSTK